MKPNDLNKEPSPEARALQAYIANAIDLLNSEQASDDDGALIYLGNPHIAIPHQLLVCSELDSNDKIIWALLREAIHRPGSPALLPTHGRIARQIGRPSQTVSECIQVLRINRWITSCARMGRSGKGTWQRSVYAIHDEPIPLADALFLDESYLEYVVMQMKSNSIRVAQAAREIHGRLKHQMATEDVSVSPGPIKRSLDNLLGSGDPDSGSDAPPARICFSDPGNNVAEMTESDSTQINHVRNPDTVNLPKLDQKGRVQLLDSGENGKINRVRNPDTVKNTEINHVRNPDTVKKTENGTTICSSNNITTTTTTAESDFSETAGLQFPGVLTEKELIIARGMILTLPADQRQFALNYLRDRIADTSQQPLRNRLGYLNWLVEQLLNGSLGPSSYGLMGSDSKREQLHLNTGPEETPEENERRWRMQLKQYGVEGEAG